MVILHSSGNTADKTTAKKKRERERDNVKQNKKKEENRQNIIIVWPTDMASQPYQLI